MAVIAIRPKDEQTYQDFKRHILRTVEQCGSCEVTDLAFKYGVVLEFIEMGAKEMMEHISVVLADEPRRVLPNGPRNVEEFLQQMAKEMGCTLKRPIERPWNLLFTKEASDERE